MTNPLDPRERFPEYQCLLLANSVFFIQQFSPRLSAYNGSSHKLTLFSLVLFTRVCRLYNKLPKPERCWYPSIRIETGRPLFQSLLDHKTYWVTLGHSIALWLFNTASQDCGEDKRGMGRTMYVILSSFDPKVSLTPQIDRPQSVSSFYVEWICVYGFCMTSCTVSSAFPK